MLTLTNHVTIDAPASQVWRALSDLKQYPEWHPFISHVTGTLRGGDVLDVRLKLPDGREPTVMFTVAEVRRHHGLLLIAHAPETGEPMCDYQVTIEPVTATQTRVSQWATCSDGLAARLAYAPVVDVQGDFDRAAESLKRQVEHLALATPTERQITGSILVFSRARGATRRHHARVLSCLKDLLPRQSAIRAVA
jgi:uncharacterized protein YndB with AHSA1/START domain